MHKLKMVLASDNLVFIYSTEEIHFQRNIYKLLCKCLMSGVPTEPHTEPDGRPTPSSRAHLMSRMARVGRQLLPTQLAHPAPHSHPHPTDSESEVVSTPYSSDMYTVNKK